MDDGVGGEDPLDSNSVAEVVVGMVPADSMADLVVHGDVAVDGVAYGQMLKEVEAVAPQIFPF